MAKILRPFFCLRLTYDIKQNRESLVTVQKQHINEVDYLRVIGLVSIVIIHSFGFYLAMPVTGPAARIFQELTVNVLRFGRYVFMFVTGVVLFYGYDGRKINITSFYRRRLKNIFIPYAVWTAIYLLIDRWSNIIYWSNAGDFVITWAENIVSGKAYSHLYYIVVAIQFYLLFPLLLAIFKPRKAGLAAWVVLIGGLAVYSIYHYVLELHPSLVTAMTGSFGAGIFNWFLQYKDRLIISYLPCYLLGGLVGIHMVAWRKWLEKHLALIIAGLILGIGLVTGEYFYLYRHLGESWGMTVSVFKPSIYFLSLGVIAVSFKLAQVLERRKTIRPLISLLAANSLGIYLIHPAVLYVVHSYLWTYQNLPGTVLVILDTSFAVAVSCLISYLLARSRYTRFIVGEAGNISRNLSAAKKAETKPGSANQKRIPPTGTAAG
ncbi:MAG TPA: acyltransferase [Spirochaetia bacterium]|nr:acyltransferase [Spirochaetia bacterium]